MNDDHAEYARDDAQDDGDDFDEIRARMQVLAENLLPLVSIVSGRRRADREDREAESAFLREVSFWERCFITALSLGNAPSAAAVIANASVEERDALFDTDDEGEVVPLRVVDDEPGAEAT